MSEEILTPEEFRVLLDDAAWTTSTGETFVQIIRHDVALRARVAALEAERDALVRFVSWVRDARGLTAREYRNHAVGVLGALSDVAKLHLSEDLRVEAALAAAQERLRQADEMAEAVEHLMLLWFSRSTKAAALRHQLVEATRAYRAATDAGEGTA